MKSGLISDLLWQASWLLGQADAAVGGVPAEDAAAEPVSPVVEFLMNPLNLILISAILFMFIVVRPQQKQMKQQQALLAGLKKNDRVVTASGIHGTVVQAGSDDPVVTIRIDENSGARMTINRESISQVLKSETKE